VKDVVTADDNRDCPQNVESLFTGYVDKNTPLFFIRLPPWQKSKMWKTSYVSPFNVEYRGFDWR
jgi:hypothetical protein